MTMMGMMTMSILTVAHLASFAYSASLRAARFGGMSIPVAGCSILRSSSSIMWADGFSCSTLMLAVLVVAEGMETGWRWIQMIVGETERRSLGYIGLHA